MNNEHVHAAGEPRVGQSGPPVRNFSGETKVVGSTVRRQRDIQGRFSRELPHRTARLADGYDAVETVTGQFMPGVRNNACLHHPDRGRALPDAPDYSQGVPMSRKGHAGFHEAQAELNHRLSCPTCAVMGG